MMEVDELAIDPSTFFRRKLVAFATQLGFNPSKTALPSVAATDDRGFDQQLFPSPRCFESSFDDWNGADFGRLGLGNRRRQIEIGSERRGKNFCLGQSKCANARDRRVGIRNLRERQILGKTVRGQIFAGARKKLQESAATGLGSASASCEV